MTTKMRTLGLGAALACAIVAGPRAARANRVNTPATACLMNDFSAAWLNSKATPWALGMGSTNGSVANPDTQFHEIMCPLVRAPNPNATTVNLYFDGNNFLPAPSTFRCTFFDYDYHGNIVSWTNASDPGPVVDKGATLTISGQYDYIVASCNMASSSRNELRGFTVGE